MRPAHPTQTTAATNAENTDKNSQTKAQGKYGFLFRDSLGMNIIEIGLPFSDTVDYLKQIFIPRVNF